MSLAKPVAVAWSLLLAVVAAAQSPEIVGGVIREPVLARLGSDRFRNPGAVWSLAYSPDGKQIAAGCDNNIHFWNTTDGRRIRSVTLDEHQFVALRYTPDGRSLFAVADTFRAMRVCCIDPSTGKVRSNVPVRKNRCPVVLSADAAYLALQPTDAPIVHVVCLATGGDWIERIPGDTVQAMAFRPDRKALAVGTNLGQLRIYDPRNGKLLSERAYDAGAIDEVAFCADDTDLIMVSNRPGPKRLARVELATGKTRWARMINFMRQVTVSSDGGAVVYRGLDAEGKYPDHWHWLDAATGKPTGKVLGVDNPHVWVDTPAYHDRLPYAVAWHPDGRTLAVSGHNGLITQWDLKEGKRLPASAEPPTAVTELYVTGDGTKVRGWARGWYEWNVKTGRQTRLTPDLGLGRSERIAISRDLKWLARMLPDGPAAVEVVDLVNRERKHLLKDLPERIYPSFLADGRMVLAFQGELRVYDPKSGTRLVQIESPQTPETRLLIADGANVAGRLIRRGQAIQITRWSLATGKVLSEWSGEVPDFGDGREVGSGAWLSPDGRHAVFLTTELRSKDVAQPRFLLLDAVTGRKISMWYGYSVDDVTFSPDGRSMLIVSHRPFSYFVREVATGEHRGQVRFGLRPATSYAFGPAAQTMFLATRPHPVEVWDLYADAGPWEPKNSDRLWETLADPKAETAYAAMRNLLAHPAEAVALLKARVEIPKPLAVDWMAARIKSLDAAAFRDREKATAELIAAGELAIAPLRNAHMTASAEARARIQAVLAKVEAQTPEKLRAIRACEVAEGLGTADATALLETWAAGDAGTTLATEAKASLERIKARAR